MVTLNQLYSNRRTKFKVSSLLQRETQQDVEQTHQMVLEDRKMFLQVASYEWSIVHDSTPVSIIDSLAFLHLLEVTKLT